MSGWMHLIFSWICSISLKPHLHSHTLDAHPCIYTIHTKTLQTHSGTIEAQVCAMDERGRAKIIEKFAKSSSTHSLTMSITKATSNIPNLA